MTGFLRKREGRENAPVQRRFSRLAAGAIALAGLFGSCKAEETPDMRCYDYENNMISVYVEGNNGKELGKELPLRVSQLAVKDENEKPLAYFCTHSGHIFWVTKDTVYIRKLSFQDGMFVTTKLLENSHIKPDEYAVPGVRVVSADIWQNPDAPWEKITVATLTNTGLFQAARFSVQDMVDNTPDRAIYNLKKSKLGKERWPENGVKGAYVKVLDSRMFTAIPLGEKGKGSVRNFYNISFTGNEERPLVKQGLEIEIVQIGLKYQHIRNITGITIGVRHDKGLGGHIVNMSAENLDGGISPIFSIVASGR